jgi:hypothetical protein
MRGPGRVTQLGYLLLSLITLELVIRTSSRRHSGLVLSSNSENIKNKLGIVPYDC